MDNDCHKAKKPSLGERIGTWIYRGNLRAFTADVLEMMEIVDVYQVLSALDRNVDESKRQLNRAGRQLLEVSYPFVMMAPLGLLIAIQSRATLKRMHVPTPAGSPLAPETGRGRQE